MPFNSIAAATTKMFSQWVSLALIAATLSRNGDRGVASGLSTVPVPADTIITTTDVPPLFDVPVWSMATLNDNDEDRATTNMNIVTYATPVAIRPSRLYAVGLYKPTLSRANFARAKTCVLQLLADTDTHISLVKTLGGSSGNDVDKEQELESIMKTKLEDLDAADEDMQLPKVLPGCVRYLQLSLVGDISDYADGEGCHDVVVCKVDKMWTSSSGTDDDENEKYLSTGKLRELGIITEQGRVATDDAPDTDS